MRVGQGLSRKDVELIRATAVQPTALPTEPPPPAMPSQNQMRRLSTRLARAGASVAAREVPFSLPVVAVAATQEQEREYLALEVHDRIAQTLSVLSQRLQLLQVRVLSIPGAGVLAAQAAALCGDALREARNIMKDLHPPLLDDLGLIPLMEDEIRRLNQDTGCRILVRLSCPLRLSGEVEITIYRIFREAMVNIQKHAGAMRVVVALACAPGEASLSVEDNGVGFSLPDALKQKRVGGLMSMQRRAQLAGGLCRIESRPGKGTRVSVWIPIALAEGQQGNGVRNAA